MANSTCLRLSCSAHVQVAINTSICEVGAFLDHIVHSTNMRCLTPRSALSGDCGFLAANLYAKSVFGEDALVNVSAEQLQDGKIGGYIRIRCVPVVADTPLQHLKQVLAGLRV